MSIVTKTGDSGSTGLMYNRRVSKCHPRVEACGRIDELNAFVGQARLLAPEAEMRQLLHRIQEELIHLMGELAVLPEDRERYRQDGFTMLEKEWIDRLEQEVARIEEQKISFKGWALPGSNPASTALDIARTVCRGAERQVCLLLEQQAISNQNLLIYLNRLSDLLWLMARQVESREAGRG